MPGPLAGTRVVELSSGWSAAAVAATILADLGANTFQVNLGCEEQLDPRLLDDGAGEDVRRWSAALDGMSSRGKTPTTLDRIDALLPSTDFLVVDDDGYRRLDARVGWDQLGDTYPDLITCAMTNLGLSGPLAHVGSTELTVQAASGVLATTGHPQTGPLRVGFPLGQQATAMNATTAMIAVWRQRASSSARLIDAAVFDTFVGYLSTFLDNYVAGQVDRGLLGNHHPLLCPWNTYSTADGTLVICIPADSHWHRLFDLIVLDQDDAGVDRDWLTPTRLEHRPQIDRWVEAWSVSRTTEGAIAALSAEGVPCAAVLGLADALDDDALRHRDLVKEHAQHGTYSGLPFRIRPL